MRGDEILLLGIGIQVPWQLVDQHLDTQKSPNELHLHVQAERGSQFACPHCGKSCPAHDFDEKRWRHLNFFQHHCYITARVPRVKCPEHGVHLVEVPWARKGSAFTLLFEQAAMALVREMPVLAAARLMDITDTRLWRIVEHYVKTAVADFDLASVQGIGLDETASKHGHNYVTVFIDMAKQKEPVLFVIPGCGKDTLKQFTHFLKQLGGNPDKILEVVCDMSPAYLTGIGEQLPKAAVTVDWFHTVQVFTRSVDEVRKREGREKPLPKHLRRAVLKRGKLTHLTKHQLFALAEMTHQGLDTATAWRIKEKLAWVREAKTPQAARWRIHHFIRWAHMMVGDTPRLERVRKALETLRVQIDRVVQCRTSNYTNARLEGFNGLFQAARARGYRNTNTFISMIYLIGSPAGSMLKST